MAPLFEQSARKLHVETPLGKDTLLLEGFSGGESFSRPYAFDLSLLSHDHAIAAVDIVGKGVSFEVSQDNGEGRQFHGRVAAFSAGSLVTRDLREYRARVVPWLWFLGKRSGCRIFQQKTVLEIAEQLFEELGHADYDTAGVRAQLPKLDYCVQYRESDLDFLSRLFEEAGIFYYFRHEADRHVLVLADAKVAYADCAEKGVPYGAGSVVPNHVTRWEHTWRFVSGAWAHSDYNFETPLTRLRSTARTVVELPGVDDYEVYDHPGRFPDGGSGDARVQQRMEEEEADWDVVEGDSTCAGLAVGGKFRLTSHECPAEEDQEYVLTALSHSARDLSVRGADGGGLEYSNTFRCIPSRVVFRPRRMTHRPRIPGPQTAVVVGPTGEEIYSDKYGRVKVQFHWDREGKADEKSSCWIRVAQVWAGKNWGVTFLPRIGQEVVVEFLEGDPDRPLITGSVYNADQTPPYELPANQTQSVVKSRSSKGGDPETFNELRFEDKKDAELVYFHAQKDQEVVVENDQSLSVGNNRTEDVGKDRSLAVGANKSETVAENKSVSVEKNHDESIGESMTLSVGKDRSTSVGGSLTLDVTKDATISIGGAQDESVAKAYTLKAQKITVTADDEITLKTGSATIVLKKSGDISIQGSKIKIEASGELALKGSKITQN
ncbi:MAG TPA: type VI secretion system tip protein TssI/VgrG [Thermoanaerobaculia bacterium]